MTRRYPIPNDATLLCGVDEAGRGPLAGAVYAAAVVLDPARPRINGLIDSKMLDAETREKLSARIKERAPRVAIAYATVEEIDRLNILRASLLAMKRAVESLGMEPTRSASTATSSPDRFRCRAIVKGDQLVAAISAASILAKVARDAEMAVMDERYPATASRSHKGYSTPEHLAALAAAGPCEIHRRSFEPVQVLLQPVLPF
jgi:ribonuclease HII